MLNNTFSLKYLPVKGIFSLVCKPWQNNFVIANDTLPHHALEHYQTQG